MQIINYYLRADSIKATAVDKWNQPISNIPTLTRGMHATLVLNLLDADGEPVTASDLAQYTTWDFAIAHDWNTTTLPQIRVTSGIIQKDNTISIPLIETNTEQLMKALGSNEQVNFGCELAGFEPGSDTPSYLLQFNIIIRNRRCDAGTGTPIQVNDGMYTAAQVRSLMSASMEVQVSSDGTNWFSTEELTEGARFFRIRNEAIAGEWSEAMPLLIAGEDIQIVDAYTKEQTNALLENKLSVTKITGANTISEGIVFCGSTAFTSPVSVNTNLAINACGSFELSGQAIFYQSSYADFNGCVDFHGNVGMHDSIYQGCSSVFNLYGAVNFNTSPVFCSGAHFYGSTTISGCSSLTLSCDATINNYGKLIQWNSLEAYGSIFFYDSVWFGGSSNVMINFGCAQVVVGCTSLNSFIAEVKDKLGI